MATEQGARDDDQRAHTFCFVILAHTDPPGLHRLVSRIRELSPAAHIVVRHEDPELVDAAALHRLGVTDLVSDVRVRWGSWAMVEAMIEALGRALAIDGVDYVSLVSGQDYPIRDLAAWERSVVAGGADALLSPMHAKPRVYQRRHFGFVVAERSRWSARALGAVLDGVGRHAPPGVELFRLPRGNDDHWRLSVARRAAHPPWWFYKASQWMTLEAELLADVLASVERDVGWRRSMSQMLIPDEIALQSVARGLARRPVSDPTSIMSFAPDAASPEWLTASLVRDLAAGSSAPFARKMPATGWEDVVAAADALVAGGIPRPVGA